MDPMDNTDWLIFRGVFPVFFLLILFWWKWHTLESAISSGLHFSNHSNYRVFSSNSSLLLRPFFQQSTSRLEQIRREIRSCHSFRLPMPLPVQRPVISSIIEAASSKRTSKPLAMAEPVLANSGGLLMDFGMR